MRPLWPRGTVSACAPFGAFAPLWTRNCAAQASMDGRLTVAHGARDTGNLGIAKFNAQATARSCSCCKQDRRSGLR